MSKENIEGFDFTKDFTQQDLFEMMKSGIYKYCEKKYDPFKINDETVMCGFDKLSLNHEMDDKLYGTMKWKIIVKLGSGYRDFILYITPFNCYIKKWGENNCLTNESRNEELTIQFRKIMMNKYGNVYAEACRSFLKEARDLEISLEESLNRHKQKLIETKYDKELDMLEL